MLYLRFRDPNQANHWNLHLNAGKETDVYIYIYIYIFSNQLEEACSRRKVRK